MIVEIEFSEWHYEEKKKYESTDGIEDFFKKKGKVTREERTEKENNEGTMLFNYFFNAKFIGPINSVPIEILNHDKIKISFYKGVEAWTDKLVSKSNKALEGLHSEKVINIHMPSNELFSVSAVTWLEDCCTEKLQRELDAGMRIIACIPRPGQRRPDYVLGKKEEQ